VLDLYYLYCLSIFQRTLRVKRTFFSESGCKDKDFLILLPNISESFFYFSRRPSLRKGDKEKNTGPATFSVRMSISMLCFSCKAGAKVEVFTIQTKHMRLFFQ
ncbi:hypothetical protein, partial [Bacteroides sp.]|uniref:hypothetical protein n=1 Tax=Bacteroides sp. TaxID=29523 RepID=UPI00345D356C